MQESQCLLIKQGIGGFGDRVCIEIGLWFALNIWLIPKKYLRRLMPSSIGFTKVASPLGWVGKPIALPHRLTQTDFA